MSGSGFLSFCISGCVGLRLLVLHLDGVPEVFCPRYPGLDIQIGPVQARSQATPLPSLPPCHPHPSTHRPQTTTHTSPSRTDRTETRPPAARPDRQRPCLTPPALHQPSAAATRRPCLSPPGARAGLPTYLVQLPCADPFFFSPASILVFSSRVLVSVSAPRHCVVVSVHLVLHQHTHGK